MSKTQQPTQPAQPAQPTQPAQPVSELAKVLRNEGLDHLVVPLEDAGYRRVGDLGRTTAEVGKAVKEAAPAVKPGEIQRVLTLWETATAKSKALPIPTLPPETKVDLTAESVKFEDQTFSIPTEFAASKSTKVFLTADELTKAQWMVIAKRTRMMYGIDLEKAYRSQKEDDAAAPDYALVWRVPSGSQFLDTASKGSVEVTLAFTAETSNLVHNRILDASVKAGTPFVAASAAVSRNEKWAEARSSRSLYITGTWIFVFASLVLDKCTAASPKLLDAVRAALDHDDEQARFDALRAVFERYGHAVPGRAELGGLLYFQSRKDMSGEVAESQVKSVVKAAVEARTANASGQAEAGFTDAHGEKQTAQRIAGEISFVGVGGDITLVANPKEWQTTVADPMRWQVINRTDLTPLADRLPEELGTRVKKVWAAGLERIWGAPPPDDYVFPDFDGMPFTLSASSGDILSPVPVTGRLAGLAPAQHLSDALAKGLAWEVEYTGATTKGQGRGLPIYRILEHQDAALAAARRREITKATKMNEAIREATEDSGDYAPVPVQRVALVGLKRGREWFAGCVDATVAQAADVLAKDPAVGWTLVPEGAVDREGARSYRLTNFATGRILGDVVTREDLSEDGSVQPVVPLVEPSAAPALAGWIGRTFTRRTP